MADEEEENFASRGEVEQTFTEATEYVKNLQELSNEDKLLFYGLYKQVMTILLLFSMQSICSLFV